MNGSHWICVMMVGSQRELYVGHDDERAAEYLEPGTCFGRGITAEDARESARRAAISIKSEQTYRYVEEPGRKYAGPRNTSVRRTG